MFREFKKAVQAQFALMIKNPIFRVLVDKELLWTTYLGSFPEGSNPLWKERTEHDCNCCKSFIRSVGGAVAIKDGKLMSIWDINIGGHYQVVADAMAALVKSQPIDHIFLNVENTAGVDKNHAQADGKIETYEHFFINIPRELVVPGAEIGTKLGDAKATRGVMLRSLTDITFDSIDTVLELIAQNSIYRGEEHKFAVESFSKLKKEFDKLPSAEAKELFCWSKFKGIPESVSKMRGTVIGTLLTDISEGKPLEEAVKAFEFKVAPANYKRPTAIATKGMVEKAKKTVVDLGYETALDRRRALLCDVSINNVLFADRSAKNVMKDVFDEIAGEAPQKDKNFAKCEEMQIEAFIANVLPNVTSMEMLVENHLCPNFVSLIAPVDPAAKNMFKWPNNFSWSYAGEMADSIKERVKEAGGKVDGVLRFSIMWSGGDDDNSDLDAHCHEPTGHIFYGNHKVNSGGNLDIDITQPSIQCKGKTAVENITYPSLKQMKDGVHKFSVNQFASRGSKGFSAEIEFDGQIFHYEYNRPVSGTVQVAEVTLKNGKFEIKHLLQSSQSTKDIWGVKTQTFQKVSTMMLSPNHWDGHGVGNKHYFFFLEGCQNDGSARGFFNEFLNDELSAHRKVFEMIGNKMKAADTPEQLSGVGFSSTQRNFVIVRVKGAFTRTLKLLI